MTLTVVPDITQSASFYSDARSNLTLQADKNAIPGGIAVNSPADSPAALFDTVSISSQSRLAVAGEIKKELAPEVTKKEKARKDEANARLSGGGFERVLSKVQFVYNQRGELIVKYMDASDRLVYQIPSELVMLQKESALKGGTSLDASV